MRLQLAAGKGAAALGAVMMLGAALTLGGCKQKGEYPMSQSSFLLNTFVEVTVYDSSSFCQESPGGEYPAVQPV